jgi:hypothetical protein
MIHLLLVAGQFPTSNKKAPSSSALKDLKAPVPMRQVFLGFSKKWPLGGRDWLAVPEDHRRLDLTTPEL